MPDASDPNPTKEQLLAAAAHEFDTERLVFEGLRGDRSRHLDRARLEQGLAALPELPRAEGTVDLIVARELDGGRRVLESAELSPERGLGPDRWAEEGRYGITHQIAVIRTDIARLIANGQPLELHGDNLYLSLDLSRENLPAGTLLRVGSARVRVNEQAHNGCKKWAQRFGLSAMQLNMAPNHRATRVRGLYFQCVEAGRVTVGDMVTVLERGEPE